jgi:multidrug efflux pump subunit AcrA (membrane-fusion protein)
VAPPVSAISILIPVLVAFVAAVPGVLAYRTATVAQRVTARAKQVEIEAGAYNRARELYESALSQLQRQLSSIQAQLNEEREVGNHLRIQVNALEDIVAKLRRHLILAGIPDGEIPRPADPSTFRQGLRAIPDPTVESGPGTSG